MASVLGRSLVHSELWIKITLRPISQTCNLFMELVMSV
jgi:hypothetical protein